MESSSDYLREIIRLLIRNLDILEKNDADCCGTTLAQCHAIGEIGRAGRLSLNELSDRLMLDKSTTSRTVNNLVESGLVSREADQDDRRYVTLMLTDSGIQAFQTIENTMGDYFKSIFESIPEDKRDQVMDSLQILIDAIHQNKCC